METNITIVPSPTLNCQNKVQIIDYFCHEDCRAIVIKKQDVGLKGQKFPAFHNYCIISLEGEPNKIIQALQNLSKDIKL